MRSEVPRRAAETAREAWCRHILEGILKGLAQWIYSLFLDALAYMGGALLELLRMDMTYFRQNVPIIVDFVDLFYGIGWGLLIGNLAFQSLKSMISGLGFEGEAPTQLFGRTLIFSFLMTFSRQICEIGMGIGNTVIQIIGVPEKVDFRPPDESYFSVDVSWVLVIAIGLILGIQILKLFFEIGERYVIVVLLALMAPLGFSMGGSKSTKDIFSGYIRMFASMILMMVMNVIFLKLILSALATMPSGALVFPWCILVVAIARVARKIDSVISKIGLNPAITGDGLGGGSPAAVAMLAARNIAHSAWQKTSSSLFKKGGDKGSNSPSGSPHPSPASSPPGGRSGGPASSGSSPAGTSRRGGSAPAVGNSGTRASGYSEKFSGGAGIHTVRSHSQVQKNGFGTTSHSHSEAQTNRFSVSDSHAADGKAGYSREISEKMNAAPDSSNVSFPGGRNVNMNRFGVNTISPGKGFPPPKPGNRSGNIPTVRSSQVSSRAGQRQYQILPKSAGVNVSGRSASNPQIKSTRSSDSPNSVPKQLSQGSIAASSVQQHITHPLEQDPERSFGVPTPPEQRSPAFSGEPDRPGRSTPTPPSREAEFREHTTLSTEKHSFGVPVSSGATVSKPVSIPASRPPYPTNSARSRQAGEVRFPARDGGQAQSSRPPDRTENVNIRQPGSISPPVSGGTGRTKSTASIKPKSPEKPEQKHERRK